MLNTKHILNQTKIRLNQTELVVRSEPSSLTMAHTVASLINHPRFVIINGKTGGLGSLNFVSSPRKPLVSLDLIQRTFGPHR